jgi:protocatechuate 3,4-dioxygenase beta subunit
MSKLLIGALAAPVVGACEAGRAFGQTAAADFYLCDGCEAVSEQDFSNLDWRTDIASRGEPGERLRLDGLVYQRDGVTPAEGVVIYAHHTNREGLYAGGGDQTEWTRRHGALRGWIKTRADGRYRFQSIKPGAYPGRTGPAHIHLFVVEPGRRPYWIDDVVFSGEFGVSPAYRRSRENRGGSGIVTLQRAASGGWLTRRDVILEAHPR